MPKIGHCSPPSQHQTIWSHFLHASLLPAHNDTYLVPPPTAYYCCNLSTPTTLLLCQQFPHFVSECLMPPSKNSTLHSSLSNFFPFISGNFFPCTLQLFQTLLQPSEVPACILKSVTTVIFYMGYIRKCRPCNKLHSGLTSNTLSDHIPVTILSVVFLPHCDNLIHFLLLLVRRKRGEENIKCIRFLWIIHYFFSIPSSFHT